MDTKAVLFPFGFPVVTFWATPFGSRTNVFLSDKAETAVETVDFFHRVGVGQGGILPRFLKADPRGWFAPEAYRPSPGSDAD
jgi:hypothetical protein